MPGPALTRRLAVSDERPQPAASPMHPTTACPPFHQPQPDQVDSAYLGSPADLTDEQSLRIMGLSSHLADHVMVRYTRFSFPNIYTYLPNNLSTYYTDT